MTDAPDPFAAIRGRFRQRLAEAAQQLEGLAPEAVRDAEVVTTIHRLAGLAGTLGYAAISDAAKALESAVRSPDKNDQELARRLERLLSALAGALAD